MNRNYNILSGALLLLVSGTCFQSCQQDDFGDLQPDIETLVAEGRYLTARSVDLDELASDTEEPRLFAVGTPYRLLAFTKPYNVSSPYDKALAEKPRFNKVAWEGETSTGMRFINIDSEPDKWFGFSARKGETGGDDNLVSLDFYGFTYGKEAEHPESYIPVNGWKDDRTTKPSELTHTETVTDGILNDLMRGVLLNQNIQTAGKTKNNNAGNDVSEWPDNAYTQSVMPFRHCFSKLRFQVSQQGDEEHPDADGNPAPSFENLYVEKIEITGTYGTGKVYLHDGKVELSGDPCDRNLPFKSGFSGRVTTKNTDVGDMIVFPSDGSALTGTTMGDGYNVGLSITVRSTEKKDIENMLVNTGSVDENGKAVIEEESVTNDDGTTATWYRGTIHKDNIVDYYNTTPETEVFLHFKQNTSYMLIITFQKDAVRIITVIPQVEEWLPGEGDAKDPWQEQALGQPQMFDNIVWSDRNLGADHYDPSGINFEKTIGYFYQAGRNIPYYPFDTRLYAHYDEQDSPVPNLIPYPTPEHKRTNSLAGETSYFKSFYRLFPIVDAKLLNMFRLNNCPVRPGSNGPSNNGSWLWSIQRSKNEPPQLFIPENKGTNYFDFVRGDVNQGLEDNQNMKWNDGQKNQPVSGSWVIPSLSDFMTIFPSTLFAGNITFRKCSSDEDAMHWSGGGVMEDKYTTLRVTVPYYKKNMEEPTGKSSKYLEAWRTLNQNSDVGTTQLEAYSYSPSSSFWGEPDGDPEDGYASVYVISRVTNPDKKIYDVEKLPEEIKKLDFYKTTEWGTIYAIKRVYTNQAYRMRWRVLVNPIVLGSSPSLYVEVCRYRCNATDRMNETNYKDYDWDHPAARLYFPICGLGDWTGGYINFGTECQYATSDAIKDGKTSAVQIKITGDGDDNQYMSVIKGRINRNFGMQIRPIGGG